MHLCQTIEHRTHKFMSINLARASSIILGINPEPNLQLHSREMYIGARALDLIFNCPSYYPQCVPWQRVLTEKAN